jgi:methylisocitrate lyase
MTDSAGKRLRQAMETERPLQVVGTINAYCALLARRAEFRAIYLSGAGVANASFALPDLGITTLNDVLEDARRITRATPDLPLLADVDTGFGSAFNIVRTVRDMTAAGVAGIHMEDQVQAKRCGHRTGKALVDADEMVDRIKTAVDARPDESFVLMARTDAHAVEGLGPAIERARKYVEAGADMIFAEALTSLEEYGHFTSAVPAPVLANLTEFGKTPLFTMDEMRDAGVRLVLYPLTAFRMMNAAVARAYRTLRQKGTQKELLDQMQTRQELYDTLDYHTYEAKLDQLFAGGRGSRRAEDGLSDQSGSAGASPSPQENRNHA